MKRTIALLTLLGLAVGTASASTIAYWRFEEGTPGVAHGGDHDDFYVDSSGNGNHMSAWEATGNPMATSDLPFTSQGGTANAVALDFDAVNDNIGTWDPGDLSAKPIDSYSFTNGWTVEATFKTHSHWWSVIVGKDGTRGQSTPDAGDDGPEAPFWFKTLDYNSKLECLVIDNSNTYHFVQSIDPLVLDSWYSVAATYDNSTLRLYLKQEDGGPYVLQSSVSITNGVSFDNFAGEFWTVGRGMFDGNPTDPFNGIIDEVRISDVALGTNEFINQDGFIIPFDIEKPSEIDVSKFTGFGDSFRLYASDYWSPAGLAHSGTQWQISSSTDFTSPAWDSGVLGPVGYATVPANALAVGSYYVRVRYQGDGTTWSDWSDVVALDTVDHTIAYWRFESSEFDPQPSNGTEHNGDQDDWYSDISGNGNHLSSWWDQSRPMATNEVPFAAIPRIGPNALSLYFDATDGPDPDDLGTFGNGGGKMIESYSFTNGWTLECTFKAADITHFQTMFGKDGKRGAGPEQPFSFKLFDNNAEPTIGLRCLVLRDDDNFDFIDTPPLAAGKWYTVVATYDKADFNLYLKSEDDADFVLQGTLNRTQGISFGALGSGTWTVGRGMWDGGPADFFHGLIDEVRVSDVPMRPEEFIQAAAPMPPIGDIVMEPVAGGFDLTWATGPDYNYVLLEKASLTDPAWSTNAASIPGGTSNVTVSVPADQPAAFYKVTSEQ